MLLRAMLLAAAFASLGSAAATAQPFPVTHTPRDMHLAAANQMGVLEYCRSHGWASDATLDAQKKVMTTLPAADDVSGSDGAEKLGQQGTISAFSEKQVTLDDLAKQHNTTTQALCTRISDHVVAAAGQMAAPKAP